MKTLKSCAAACLQIALIDCYAALLSYPSEYIHVPALPVRSADFSRGWGLVLANIYWLKSSRLRDHVYSSRCSDFQVRTRYSLRILLTDTRRQLNCHAQFQELENLNKEVLDSSIVSIAVWSRAERACRALEVSKRKHTQKLYFICHVPCKLMVIC